MFQLTLWTSMYLIILQGHQSLANTNVSCPASVGHSDCTDVQVLGRAVKPSGKYHIIVGAGRRGVWAYCDMDTDGGGWTVIQRRSGPEVDFYRTWKEYEQGFGDPDNDYWIGNTYIHSMTASKRYVLRIELTDWDNTKYYAEYSHFVIGGASCKYYLESIGTYCGDCGDSLVYHVGQKFTTKDQDNDMSPVNCAQRYHGAWWYKSCHHSNLNGHYKMNGRYESGGDGINWEVATGENYSYKKTEMKIRPYNY